MCKIAILIAFVVFISSSTGESGTKKGKSSFLYQRLFIQKTRPVQSSTEVLRNGPSNKRTEVDNALSNEIPSDIKEEETGSWVKDSVVISRAYFKEEQDGADYYRDGQDKMADPNSILVSKTPADDHSDEEIKVAEAKVYEIKENQVRKLSTAGIKVPLVQWTNSSTDQSYEISENGNSLTINKITNENGIEPGEELETESEDVPSVNQINSRRYKVIGEGRTLAVKDGKGYWLDSPNVTEPEDDILRTPPMDLKALRKAFSKLTKSKPEDKRNTAFKSGNLGFGSRKVNSNITGKPNVHTNSEAGNRVIKSKNKVYKITGEGRTLAVKDGKAFWVGGNTTEANMDTPLFDTGKNRDELADTSLRFESMATSNIARMERERLFESLKRRVEEILSKTRKRGNRKSKNPEHPN